MSQLREQKKRGSEKKIEAAGRDLVPVSTRKRRVPLRGWKLLVGEKVLCGGRSPRREAKVRAASLDALGGSGSVLSFDDSNSGLANGAHKRTWVGKRGGRVGNGTQAVGG